jgi:hypothetical protein
MVFMQDEEMGLVECVSYNKCLENKRHEEQNGFRRRCLCSDVFQLIVLSWSYEITVLSVCALFQLLNQLV